MDQPSQPSTTREASLSDYLAAERTLLAWIRTGLALMGFGFVVARFGLFLQEIQVVKVDAPAHSYGFSLKFGVALIALGVAVNLLAGLNHINLIRRLDRGELTHSTTHAVVIAFILAIVGVVVTIYLLSI